MIYPDEGPTTDWVVHPSKGSFISRSFAVGSVVCRQLLRGLLGCSQLCVEGWSAVGCVQSVGVQAVCV